MFVCVILQVSLYALQCLPRIIPSLAIQSGALVPPVVAALTSNLASKNTNIFTAAEEALTVLTKHIGKLQVYFYFYPNGISNLNV
jgi:uncharacterized membrane protein